MSKTVRVILAVILLVVGIAVGAFAFFWFSGGSGEASAPISAPTLPPAAEATAAAEGEAAAADAGGAVTFAIVPAESEVRFMLDEDLRGERITVVGTTREVAGQIRVNFADPAASEVGTIRINMRTLATDNEFRNRAIRGQILRTSEPANEFSDFVPQSITGLPETVTIGQPFSFQISGTFTVLGTPRPITFDVTVTPVSETRIEGSARAVINRNDWGLTIPSVPGVANVEEEVELEIAFVAVPA
ncbi:MAG: YceI family protein [Candidatus Flexifilum sp.]